MNDLLLRADQQQVQPVAHEAAQQDGRVHQRQVEYDLGVDDALADAGRMAQQGAADARDVVREIIEERPYTVALAALAVGFVLGRMGRQD